MHSQLSILTKHRKLLLSFIDDLTNEQLCEIPYGFNYNIIWNLGHLLVTQQLLSYGLTNQPFKISSKIIDKYRKGSEAFDHISEEEVTLIKEQFVALLSEFEIDLQASKFQDFNMYTTSMGLELSTIDESIDFMMYHEGIHFGIIVSLKKLITKK